MKCENIVKWENGKVGSKERYRVKYRLWYNSIIKININLLFFFSWLLIRCNYLFWCLHISKYHPLLGRWKENYILVTYIIFCLLLFNSFFHFFDFFFPRFEFLTQLWNFGFFSLKSKKDYEIKTQDMDNKPRNHKKIGSDEREKIENWVKKG